MTDAHSAHKKALLAWLNCRRDHLKHPDSAYTTERYNKAVSELDRANRAIECQQACDEEEAARDADGDRRYQEWKDEGGKW